ncbi:MAG: ATP-dependent DNA ligase [Cytophagaceae bacterium]|nr:ATP-dependent DNA ligase [Gemmatimonadaceae bacterium]
MITHPEKVLFPDDGITKGELAAYYEAISPLMLPHLVGRPVTMERYPSGIGEEGFMHKSVAKGFPAWLERVDVPKKGGTVHYPLVNDLRSLLWITNQNCITAHLWTSRVPELHQPDCCVIDLDPSEEEQPDVLRAACLAVRDLVAEVGLTSWIKTSGSKGFHIFVPVDRTTGYGDVGQFSNLLAAILMQRDPAHLTQEFAKVDRGGRIYLDTGRNGPGATFAAAYAVRAKTGAPVSAPCTWDEVEGGSVRPRTFTLRTMAQRVATVPDPWSGLLDHAYSLTDAIERLKAMRS